MRLLIDTLEEISHEAHPFPPPPPTASLRSPLSQPQGKKKTPPPGAHSGSTSLRRMSDTIWTWILIRWSLRGERVVEEGRRRMERERKLREAVGEKEKNAEERRERKEGGKAWEGKAWEGKATDKEVAERFRRRMREGARKR
ncbi:hypothetical protein BT69DRAFT_1356702 [Atractiella rhizophila]|nr:hypothetical protein BT69DRAFT_1356702 [Atractiella rhizophila]